MTWHDLFDPFLAVQTSDLDALPDQIDAVYDEMVPRQPLRYVLADDPGAGKTIMAGLFCKELMIGGDVERCLVVAPIDLAQSATARVWPFSAATPRWRRRRGRPCPYAPPSGS